MKKKALAVLMVGLILAATIAIVWLILPPPRDKIAIIEISGELITDEESEEFTTTGELWRSLEKARREEGVKAVVLVVDSPGGAAATVYEMYSMIKRFEKPIVAFARGTAASGSYLVSLGADKVIAHPFSEIGSVGVFIELPKPVPVEPEPAREISAISSGIFKTLWEDGVLDEIEREFLKLKVKEAANTFFEIVYERTEIKRERVEGARVDIEDPYYVFREGGWFSGTKAFELGLVDKLGDIEDALRLAADLAGIDFAKAEIITIDPPKPGTFEPKFYETPLYQDNESLPIILK